MARCEVPLTSVNMRPREVRDGSVLLCIGYGEGGEGRAGGQEKEAGGGGESAQLHPDLGGAGREPGPQPASRPGSTCASCTWLPNEEPQNPKFRPLRFPSIGSSSPAPRPAPPRRPGSQSRAGSLTPAGSGLLRGGEKGTRVAGATGGGAHYVMGPGGNRQWGGGDGFCRMKTNAARGPGSAAM